jgi:hypothetical protein
MILEIAHFWSSIAIFSDERGRYEIRGVIGPDEFHDGYPDSATPGLNNNSYTNLMAVWVMCRVLEVLDLLSDLLLIPLSGFDGIVDTALNQIRQAGAAQPAILIRLVDRLGQLLDHADTDQRAVLTRHSATYSPHKINSALLRQ